MIFFSHSLKIVCKIFNLINYLPHLSNTCLSIIFLCIIICLTSSPNWSMCIFEHKSKILFILCFCAYDSSTEAHTVGHPNVLSLLEQISRRSWNCCGFHPNIQLLYSYSQKYILQVKNKIIIVIKFKIPNKKSLFSGNRGLFSSEASFSKMLVIFKNHSLYKCLCSEVKAKQKEQCFECEV